MRKLLKVGLVVPAALALAFVGFSVAMAENTDNNTELNQDLNGDLNGESKKSVGVEVDTPSASSQATSPGAADDLNGLNDDRQIVDRRGRTPGKTAVTKAAGQDRWWWGGGGWGGSHHNGSGGGSGGNSSDEDDDEGPDEGGETVTNP